MLWCNAPCPRVEHQVGIAFPQPSHVHLSAAIIPPPPPACAVACACSLTSSAFLPLLRPFLPSVASSLAAATRSQISAVGKEEKPLTVPSLTSLASVVS